MDYTEIISKTQLKNLINSIPKGDSDMIFLSGSLVQGIGNKYSDIDVFVLSENIFSNNIVDFAEYDQKFRKTGFINFQGVNIDIEYWDLSIIREIVNKLNTINFSNPQVRVYNLMKFKELTVEEALSFLHRFYIGEFIEGSKGLKKLRDGINFENYFKIKSLYVKVGIDNAYEDILGNISEKNYYNALLLLRENVLKCLGIQLSEENISYDRDKWILPLFEKNFETISSEKLHDIFWKEVTDENVESLISVGMKYLNEVLEGVNYD